MCIPPKSVSGSVLQFIGVAAAMTHRYHTNQQSITFTRYCTICQIKPAERLYIAAALFSHLKA